MKKTLTLCVPLKGRRVLLGMKKRGFGAGRWNGFGGKVEEGESIEQATLRELHEEVGIKSGALKKHGVIDFAFENEDKILEVHIFALEDFAEEPVETEEMTPKWFDYEAIPYSQMWIDDEQWLPLLLEGKTFRGYFLFDRPADAEYSSKIIEQKLEEISSFV